MDARVFFDNHAPRAFAASRGLFRLAARFAFHVTGAAGGRWLLDPCGEPPCRTAEPGEGDCRIEIGSADFGALLAEPLTARMMLRDGRMRIEGRLEAALHLPSLLRILASPTPPVGLAVLLAGMSDEEFRRDCWPDELLVRHGAVERFAGIADLPAFASVDALLSSWPGRVRLADRFAGRLVSVDEARRLFRQGHHLALSDVERVFPGLRGPLERLRWETGLPVNAHGRCLVYISPAGSGEAAHFDQNVNFILQLRGAKDWRVAPNLHVRRPTDRFTTASPSPSAELAAYCVLPLPRAMPEEARRHRLEPGSVLFLPRGYWHETQATQDSLSLNFTFDQPTWADVILPEIRRALLQKAHWRGLAQGARAADPSASAAAHADLSALLRGLADDLAGVDADAALAALSLSESSDLEDLALGAPADIA
jgi:50S ribosomal protein L16 3-hydroxylase